SAERGDRALRVGAVVFRRVVPDGNGASKDTGINRLFRLDRRRRPVIVRLFFDPVRIGPPSGQPGAVNTPPPTRAPPTPSPWDGVRERLDSLETFRRFYEVVAPLAGRWLAHAGVPEPDHEDVFHDAVVAMWHKHATYDPEIGSWEDWAFGYVVNVAR